MATIAIPKSVQAYFPKTVKPSELWVKYNSKVDSLIIYFTGEPVPTVWDDVDEYVYIGFSSNNETAVTGVMIENFSEWLLMSNPSEGTLETAV
jgi:hypothetical protein